MSQTLTADTIQTSGPISCTWNIQTTDRTYAIENSSTTKPMWLAGGGGGLNGPGSISQNGDDDYNSFSLSGTVILSLSSQARELNHANPIGGSGIDWPGMSYHGSGGFGGGGAASGPFGGGGGGYAGGNGGSTTWVNQGSTGMAYGHDGGSYVSPSATDVSVTHGKFIADTMAALTGHTYSWKKNNSISTPWCTYWTPGSGFTFTPVTTASTLLGTLGYVDENTAVGPDGLTDQSLWKVKELARSNIYPASNWLDWVKFTMNGSVRIEFVART